MSRSRSCGRRRVGRDRRALVVLAATLIASELLGICASASVTGHYSPRQFIAFVTALAGSAFLVQGDHVVRRCMAFVLIALAGWGIYHLAAVSHTLSVHSVGLAAQSAIRSGAGAALLSPVGKRVVEAFRKPQRPRR